MENVLEVKGVSKIFEDKGKKFHALRDVTFSIRDGEIFALLGPNGAGKTTLLNIMIGVVLQEKGEISILGRDNTDRKVFDSINGISANTSFHWGLKSIDILRFYGKVYGIRKKEAEKRIAELADMLEIKDILYSKFSWLSTGERMRLSFAKALINKPKVLLLDEPTLGLDPHISVKARKIILDINKKHGTTILLTSHDMAEVERLADRIGFINKGRMIDIGDVEEVKKRHFDTYDLEITPSSPEQKSILKRQGFAPRGKLMVKKVHSTDNINHIIKDLQSKGVDIADINTKKPSLEDYFIKMSK